MTSLATCIRKAGKLLTKEDANAIREIRNDLIAVGAKKAEADSQAINEYLDTMQSERDQIVKQIEAEGGTFPKSGSSKFSQQAPEKLTITEVPLRYKIEDDFIEALVEKHSDHPQAQLSKMGALVQDISERSEPGKTREILDKAGDTSKELILSAMPQSKLNEVIRNAMFSVHEYVRTMKRMDGFINERLEEQAETGRVWRTMFRKDKKNAALMGEIMHEATRAATDPSKPFTMPKTFDKMDADKRKEWIKRRRDHAILKKAWDRLSPEAQQLYKKVRDEYATNRTEVLKALEERIKQTEADDMAKAKLMAELRSQFEAGRVDPYFPLTRFGKHWGTAKDRKTGEVIAFSKFESRSQRDQWVKEMRKAGFRSFASEDLKSDLDNVNRIDPSFVTRVTDIVQDEKLQDEIWQMYLRSLPERSARTAFIHRKNRLGYATDALRAYGFHMFHGTHQLGKLNFGHQLQTHLEGTEQEAKELVSRADRIRESLDVDGLEKTHKGLHGAFPEYRKTFKRLGDPQKAIDRFTTQAEVDAPWATPLATELRKRHEYNMNPVSAVWATRMTSFGFFWFLSTSPAAGVLNLTQTAIVGLPTLGARFSFNGAAGELGKASFQLTRTRGDFKNALRGDERRAFEEFDRIGVFSKTRTRDLMGYAEHGENFASKTQTVIDVASWIFHHTEKWNREVTAIAAYRLSRKAGRNHSEAILEAEEMVEMSHFDYTNTNRPRFMQGNLPRVVFLFRNYSLNMTYRLIRDFKDGYLTKLKNNPNVSKRVQKEAAQRLTGILGMTGLFAGLSGMPLAWAMHSIMDAILGDENEPYNSYAALRAHLTEIWGEKAATFIMKGAWDAATDATLSNRASLNNLWIREVPDQLTGEKLFQHLAVEAFGPLAGVGMNMFAGADNIRKGQGYVERGLEKMVPKFVSDIMKTIRFATEGALNYDRDVILSPEEFTNRDLFIQAMGFSPAKLTTRYEQQRAIKDHARAIETRRKYLMNRLFMTAKLRDMKEQKKVVADIAEFNKTSPLPISVQNIMQAAKTRANYDMRTINGVVVHKNLHGLHEKYRFTDRDQ